MFRTVDRRWAIINTVLPFISASKAFCIFASFSGSAKELASSSTTIGASFKIARASAIRCISPPERYTPLAPITASSPPGVFSRISPHWASCAARNISSSVASGRAARILSRILFLKSLTS